MSEESKSDPEDFFKHPKNTAHKRYEALRSYYLEELTQEEAAKRMGYSTKTFQSLGSNFQNGKIQFFIESQQGPTRRRISDEIDSNHRLSSEWVHISCDFQHFGGNPAHFWELHRQIPGQITQYPMVKTHLSNPYSAHFSALLSSKMVKWRG